MYYEVPGASYGDRAGGDRDYVGGGGHGRTNIPNNTAASNKPKNDKSDCQDYLKRPIIVSSGTKVETYPVFSLPGEMGLNFTLYYNAALKVPQTVQANPYWSTNLQYSLITDHCYVDKQGDLLCGAMLYLRPDGSQIVFSGAPQGGPYTENGGGGLATLSYDPVSATYTLHDEDATTKVFDVNGYLKSITDRSGIGWTIAAASTTGGYTYTVTHTNGRSFTVTYGPIVNGDETVTVTDPAGHVYTLQMTGAIMAPNFLSITYPGTPATTVAFKYSLPALPYLLTEVDYNGAPYDYTSYDTTSTDPYYGWATANYLADNSEGATISYAKDAAGNLQATITNSLGHRSVQTYDGTNGPGGPYNGQLSKISDDEVTDCGATNSSRSYDANGNLSQTVDNNGNVHTYTYAATGQLQSEVEASGTSLARTTNYTWDPSLQLNRLTSVTVVGWSKTTYTYNAQNRLASVAVTDLSGAGGGQTLTTTYGYTLYANGMVHTVTVTRPSPNNSDTDTYTYDAYGDLTSLANGLGQTTTYGNYNGLGEVGQITGPNGDVTDYTYDARGRVATKTTHPNGTTATWTYGYDGFGLLASLAAPDGGTTAWNRDAEMRVTSIVRNDKDGASTESFGYDANGDVTSHTVSRNGVTTQSETISYDALGRVYRRQGMHGQSLTYAYDGNGNVVSVTDATGHTVSNQYDALNRLTRKVSSGGASPPMPATAPGLSVPSSSSNGSYSVSWNTVSGATGYTLQEQANGGAWATVQNSASTSWAASGKSDGSYGYRVRACNGTGCSAWSGVASVTVQRIAPPPAPASLSVPATSSGSVALSWPASSTATSYSLQHRLGTGSWSTAYSGSGTSATVTESASGSYTYQVQACNAGGCSGWTGSSAVAVTIPPASAPGLSVPSSSTTGSYTVSWSGVGGATSYTLQEQVNGGSWSTIQTGSATSRAVSGKGNGSYGYRVQACNAGGCGPWSGTGTIHVTLVPAVPTGLQGTIWIESATAAMQASPATSGGSASTSGGSLQPMSRTYFYTLSASWNASSRASSYNLQYCQQGGTCSTASATSTSIGGISVHGTSYTINVRACNAGGCSGWSASVTPTVVQE